MRRKGGRSVGKLVFFAFILGAYSFWKRGATKAAWSEETGTVTYHENAVLDSREPGQGNDRDALLFPFARAQSASPTNQRWWQPDARAGRHSRQLLALLPNCTPRAVDQFPWDFLTAEQRKRGFLTLHILVAFYMFLALAIVCDRYFVPSLEVLCELLNLQTDVAGATFMAAGSSAPELATAVIGVFLAKADVGLSTVVGSAIYNVMFVISMSALFATSVIQLHWWPMFRDCLAYFVSVLALVLIICDAAVQWYEALTLLVLYVLYVGFMFFNDRLEQWCVPRISRLVCCHVHDPKDHSASHTGGYETFEDHAVSTDTSTELKDKDPNETAGENTQLAQSLGHAHQEAESWPRLCERPEGGVWLGVLWVVSMPVSVLLFLTVPDCRRPSGRRWFWLTFLLSLLWLSFFSFLMVWMITVIGYTLSVPDSVMSLTFIAFGVSLPDVVSSVLVVRDGLGDMAVSNAIGSNVFDILVCLGVPWLLETCILAPGHSIPVYSQGLLYSSIMLLSTVAFLLLVTHVNGWKLTKRYGCFLLVVYVLYTVMASLYELNVFGYFHPPECSSSY